VTSQFILKIYHALSQGVEIHLLGSSVTRSLAYLMILAVHTSHAAIAKEDSPGPSGTRNGGFLAMMIAA